MFLSLKTLYRKRTVIWPFTFTQLYGLYHKYKNKNVDLFGTNYYNQCYFSSDNMELNDGRLIEKRVCMAV